MNKKLKYFYLAAGGLILCIYILLVVIFFTRSGRQREPAVVPTPTSTNESSNVTIPPLDQAKAKAKQGTPLTKAEQKIRESLITSAASTGSIYEEKKFSIVYRKNENVFQIRLLSADGDTSIQAAIAWLKGKGLSMNGICKLPVIVYISPRLLQQDASPIAFRPLLSECG